MFDPGLKIGQVIENSDIVEIFKCSNMGGMRRSKATNTLVLVSDYTKGIYHDKWIGGVLHYTGMGKVGNQDINRAQNKTLANYKKLNEDNQSKKDFNRLEEKARKLHAKKEELIQSLNNSKAYYSLEYQGIERLD